MFTRVEVRNGRRTSFWFDIWSQKGSLYNLMGPRGFIDIGISRDTMVDEVLRTHRTRNHRVELLNVIEQEITKIRGMAGLEEDKILWRMSEHKFSAKFRTKETWRMLRPNQHRVEWYRGVWFKHATPKYAFIAWLASHNRLSTGDRVATWNAGMRKNCVFCGLQVETRNHIFFSCSNSTQVWQPLMSKLLAEYYSTDWDRIVPLLHNSSFDKLKLFLFRYTFQSTLYHVWRERNRRRHGEEPLTPNQMVKMVDKNMRNRLSALRMVGNFTYDNEMIEWFASRPP